MVNNVEKVIKLGKIWMKNSVDPGHDFEHVSRVEAHAINIYNELKPKNISLDLVKIAIWWHDSYKSRCKKTTLDSIFNEGTKSAKIFSDEVGPLLDFRTLKLVSRAIRNHNRGFYILFNHKKLDTLSMILIEADQLDGLNSTRSDLELKRIKNPVVYVLDITFISFIPLFVRIIHRTRYSEEILKLFLKKK